jgi:hypothetical protein
MCKQSRSFWQGFTSVPKILLTKNAESPMTPVGPDVFEESSGFPFIERASVCLRTIVLEMSIIPPVDFGLCTKAK